MIPLPCNTEQDCPTKFTFPLLITELEREAFIDELLWLSLDTGGWLVSQVGDCPLTSRTPDTITQQGMVLTELARHLLFSHWIFHVLPVLETGNKCSLIYLIVPSTSQDWCRQPQLDWISSCCCRSISPFPGSSYPELALLQLAERQPQWSGPGPSELSPCSSCYQQFSWEQ